MRRLGTLSTSSTVLALAGLLAGVTVALPAASPAAPPDRGVGGAPAEADAAPGRPNVVLVQMDDFSTELLPTMAQAQRMRAEGAEFRDSYVVNSLCCPSRASLFTGQTPHHTGVLTNTPNDPEDPIGGWEAYQRGGNVERTFHLALERSGYTTGFTGKFMNGFEPFGADGEPRRTVPGWTEFRPIFGGGYNGWGYRSGRNLPDGSLEITHHPAPPASASRARKDAAYMQTLTTDIALDFISRHEDADAPYFLEVATYGPHGRLANPYRDDYVFPPAFGDRPGPGEDRMTGGNCGLVDCADLTTDDLVGFDDDRADNAPVYDRGRRTEPAPAWRDNPVTTTPRLAERNLRDRARMVQSIDRMLERILDTVGADTYVVLTSDNGFHLGQHQLNGGKGTPYDSDARVPMLVVGPGVVPGERTQQVSNLDLAPTFERLAGLRPAPYRDGTSFDAALTDPQARGSRHTFQDYTYARSQPGEVDGDQGAGGTIDIIPSYVAVRSPRGLLARFDLDDSWRGEDFAWELYDYGPGSGGFERTNSYAEHHREPWVRDLRRRIEQWSRGDGCPPARCRSLTR